MILKLHGIYRLLTMSVEREPNREHLTVKEAAFLIDMSVEWLYNKIRTNTGPPVKKRGCRILIPRDKFNEWASQDVIP